MVKKKLSIQELENIKYCNLHAHSEYSILDGIGKPKDHFLETLAKGHCGCALTDHGSYASAFDLYFLKDNRKNDKKVAKAMSERKLDSYPVVQGSELYIYDDRFFNEVQDLVTNHPSSIDNDKARELIDRLQHNPLHYSIFGRDSDFKEDRMSEKKTKSKAAFGATFVDQLNSGELSHSDLIEGLKKIALMSTKSSSYKYNHITVMAKNNEGHKNLCYLSSIANRPEHFYIRPRVPISKLFERKSGLIVTTGCFIGIIPQAIFRKTGQERPYLKDFLREFKDDFYIEMHISKIVDDWNGKEQKFIPLEEDLQAIVNRGLLELAKEYNLEDKIYITQDSHMPKKEDKIKQDLMIIGNSSNSNGWHFSKAYYVMPVVEMYEQFLELFPEKDNETFINWCETSIEVVNKCQDITIDTSFKTMDVDYENHYMVNPIRVKSEKIEQFITAVSDQIKEGETELDKFILNNQIRAYLLGRRDQSFLFDEIKPLIDKLPDSWIDENATNERKSLIQKIEKDLDSLHLEHKHISVVDEVFSFSKDNYFKKEAFALRVALRTIVYNGKIDLNDVTYLTRLCEEIKTIQLNGVAPFVDYFMVFEEIIDLICSLGELKGPGRGSAGGALFSYALDITDVDPIKRNLPFWRFLIRERVGLIYIEFEDSPNSFEGYHPEAFEELLKMIPKEALGDEKLATELFYVRSHTSLSRYFIELKKTGYKISGNPNNSTLAYYLGLCDSPKGSLNRSSSSVPDIDFDSSCRDLLLRYLVKTRGEDRVALIGSYSGLKVKSAIKNVLRIAHKLDSEIAPFSAKLQNNVNNNFSKIKFSEEEQGNGELWLFNRALELNIEFKKFFDKYPKVKNWTTEILEITSARGIHACGVLFFSESLIEQIPCYWSKDKAMYVTELDKDMSEDIGAIKMDFLGLTALEILRDAFVTIRDSEGIDYFKKGTLEKIIDTNDPKVLKALERAQTHSIFQANTPVQTQGYKGLNKVGSVEVMSALNAIYRPGPMGAGMHKTYTRRNNGEEEISYLHPILEDILSDTYGIITYQEQVMEIVQKVGGFTPFEADKIRKAMGKKKFDIIEKYGQLFIENAMKLHGIEREICEELWSQMKIFAEYSFNRAHSFAYGALGFLCGYMREYHPLHWARANFSVLTKKGGDTDKKNYKSSQRIWGQYLKTPDINHSQSDFRISKGSIYMPFFSIDGIGEDVGHKITQLAPFEDFRDFILKLKANGLENKDLIEKLIYSGALDSFSEKLITTDYAQTMRGHYERKEDFPKSLMANVKKFISLQDSDLDISELEKYNLGMLVDEERILEILESEVFKKKGYINKYSFRAKIILEYYRSLRPIKMQTQVKNALKVLEKDKDAETILYILKNDSVKGVDLGDGRIALSTSAKTNKTTYFDPEKYAEGATKDVLSKKEGDELAAMEEKLQRMDTKHFILEELRLLKFSAYNFNGLFQKENKSFKQKGKVYTPEELEDKISLTASYLRGLLGKIHSSISNLSEIKDMTSFASEVDGILLGLETIECFVGKRERPDIDATVEAKVNILPTKTKQLALLLFHLRSLEYDIANPLREFYELKCEISTSKLAVKILKKISGTRETKEALSWDDMVSSRKVTLDSVTYGRALFLAAFLGGGRNLIATLENSGFLTKSSKVYSEISLFLKGLNLTSENLEELKRALSTLDLNLDFALDQVGPLTRGCMEGHVLPSELLALATESFYLQGMIFRPHKKKDFLKEYGKGHSANALIIFKIVNETSSIDCIMFQVKGLETRVAGGVRKFVDMVDNYMPTIVKGKLSYSERSGFDAQFTPTSKKSFHFLMEKV